MIKELVHDRLFLGLPSEVATADDAGAEKDLLDTLVFHREKCVGMAANMIGVRKRIIVFLNDDGKYITMLNPEIIKKSDPYTTAEGCLSLIGEEQKCKRYKSVKIRWQSDDMRIKIKTFTGFTAQIIQHEIDHCNGILI